MSCQHLETHRNSHTGNLRKSFISVEYVPQVMGENESPKRKPENHLDYGLVWNFLAGSAKELGEGKEGLLWRKEDL
jgi:hypothetical protein